MDLNLVQMLVMRFDSMMGKLLARHFELCIGSDLLHIMVK